MTRASRSEHRRIRADATGFEFVHLLDDPPADPAPDATPSAILSGQRADDAPTVAAQCARPPRIEIEFLWGRVAEPAPRTTEPDVPLINEEPTTPEREQAEVAEDAPLIDYEMRTLIELAPIPATPRPAPSRFAFAALDDERLPISVKRSRFRRR